MGERDWYKRYRYAREYADEQAAAYERSDEVVGWRYAYDQKRDLEKEPPTEQLTGAAWVVSSDARTLVQVQGNEWQYLVDACERLAAQYKEQAS